MKYAHAHEWAKSKNKIISVSLFKKKTFRQTEIQNAVRS